MVKLVKKNKRFFKKNSTKPFTGEVEEQHKSSAFTWGKNDFWEKAESFLKKTIYKQGIIQRIDVFNKNSSKRFSFFKHGEHAIYEDYYPNNSIRVRTIKHKNDERVFDYEEYYQSGKIKEKGKRIHERNINETFFHTEISEDWRENYKYGLIEKFHENGNVSMRVNCREDTYYEGLQEWFFEDGSLDTTVIWTNKRWHSRKTYRLNKIKNILKPVYNPFLGK